MLDEVCHFTGVVDWAEAEIRPFGMNLHSIQFLTGEIHLRKGLIPYHDCHTLADAFWSTFTRELSVSEDTVRTIKTARTIGLLLLMVLLLVS